MPHRPRFRGWLIAALLVGAGLLLAQLSPYLGDYGDDAEFLVLGQGLATGRGYAWINNPEAAPHNRYPPGYPVLLAGALLGSGTARDAFAAIIPAKTVTALSFAGSVALLWPIARRRLGPALGALAVALYALNPFAIRFAVQVMSDVPYILVELAALAWADRLLCSTRGTSVNLGLAAPDLPAGASLPLVGTPKPCRPEPGEGPAALPADGPQAGEERSGFRYRDWVALGVLLALGAYFRSVGEAAGVGVIAWAWWRSRRGGLVTGVTFLVLMVPWWVRDVTLAGGWRYLQEFSAATYQDPNAGNISLSDLLARAIGNAAFVLGKPGALGLLGIVGGAVAGVLLVVGYWRTLRRVGGAAEWAVVPLVLAVLVWPIRTGRYLLPVVPLAGIYGLAGGLVALVWLGRVVERRWGTNDHAWTEWLSGQRVPHIGRRGRPAWRRAGAGPLPGDRSAGQSAPPYAAAAPSAGQPATASSGPPRVLANPSTIILALGVVFALFEALYTGRESLANVRALSGGSGAANYYRRRPDWAHYLEAAAWVRGAAGPSDVALTRRHFAFYVYSGHFTDKYRFDVSDDELDYLTHGFGNGARRFVVEDAFEELRGDFSPLQPALRARGYDLQLRFETAAPAVRVWELTRRVP